MRPTWVCANNLDCVTWKARPHFRLFQRELVREVAALPGAFSMLGGRNLTVTCCLRFGERKGRCQWNCWTWWFWFVSLRTMRRNRNSWSRRPSFARSEGLIWLEELKPAQRVVTGIKQNEPKKHYCSWKASIQTNTAEETNKQLKRLNNKEIIA